MNPDKMQLTQNLIRFQTITPSEAGSLAYLEELLKSIGFQVIVKEFDDIDKSSKPTWNIYAYTHKNSKRNLTFIGHMDVVHPGHDSDWTYPPFEPTIENGILYGRGTSDMKSTIACFISAASKVIGETDNGISMLLTYDEEGNAINGTKKMLHYLHSEGFTFTDALTGEPTCSKKVGDTIKVGRRGSINFTVDIIGKQGHVAYSELANNPVYAAANVILALKNHKFDTGNEFFQPTNLEITGVESSTKESNVIPNSFRFLCNVRFNNEHTADDIENAVLGIIKENSKGFVYKVDTRVSGQSFIAKNLDLANLLKKTIKTVTGIDADFSTSGGTSDARFMKDYANVIEFGVLNQMAHKIDEHIPVADIETVEAIYTHFLQDWCKVPTQE